MAVTVGTALLRAVAEHAHQHEVHPDTHERHPKHDLAIHYLWRRARSISGGARLWRSISGAMVYLGTPIGNNQNMILPSMESRGAFSGEGSISGEDSIWEKVLFRERRSSGYLGSGGIDPLWCDVRRRARCGGPHPALISGATFYSYVLILRSILGGARLWRDDPLAGLVEEDPRHEPDNRDRDHSAEHLWGRVVLCTL